MARPTSAIERSRSRLLMRAVLAVALGAISGGLLAAAPGSPRFTRLSVDDGLSQSSVQAILQDRKGLLWFGTQEGLNRYDGYRFTVHRARDQEGFLGDHDINALIEDAIGTWGRDLERPLSPQPSTLAASTAARRLRSARHLALVRSETGKSSSRPQMGGCGCSTRPSAGCRARALTDGAFARRTHITALARGRGTSIWAGRARRTVQGRSRSRRAGRTTHASARRSRTGVLHRDDLHGEVWIGRSDGEPLRYRPLTQGLIASRGRPAIRWRFCRGRMAGSGIGARRAGLSRLDRRPEISRLSSRSRRCGEPVE